MSPTFEGLPTEVREMILECYLCVEVDIAPFPTHYEGKGSNPSGEPTSELVCKETTETPTVALLVNKTIREEALRLMFGKNVWRLS